MALKMSENSDRNDFRGHDWLNELIQNFAKSCHSVSKRKGCVWRPDLTFSINNRNKTFNPRRKNIVAEWKPPQCNLEWSASKTKKNRNEPERTGSIKQNNPIKISFGNHLVVKPFEQRSTDRFVWRPTGPKQSKIWKFCWSWSGPRFGKFSRS